MRRRITLTMAAVVAAALLVATLGTFLLLQHRARADARRELGRQATELAAGIDDLQRPQVASALVGALRLEDLRILCIGMACRVPNVPPQGIDRADLDIVRLRQGATITGTGDGGIVFAAAGVPPQNMQQNALIVVVLTRRVQTPFPAGIWVVATVTLLIAGAVAADLGRRLTRPLREAQAATRRIAGGDLATRVPTNPGDGEELAGLSESINAMAAGLERSRGLERQFLLSVSHDLRTPLTSIRGYAEALADGRAPDPGHAAGIILSEARRLERLVQDLLELAKLDARRFSLDVRSTNVAEVVADTVEGFRPAADDAGVALTVRTDALHAAADPDRLAQVTANLIENGLKYARSAIDVSVAAAVDSVEIAVQDDGPGIRPDELANVFEPFYRSARTPSREVGTGLGLAIVHELVEAMGGTVRAESVGGTRVTVRLPAWSSATAVR
jgi:signal transduction histidine kinase